MSHGKCFINNKGNKTDIIPNKNTKYDCKVVLQRQSVYYNMENKGIKFYPQVFLEERAYGLFLIT